MKKIWKISACALATAFTLSAVTACDKGSKEEKSNITADQVLAIGDSIQEALADVQSFNFGASTKTVQNISGINVNVNMESGAQISAMASLNRENLDAKLSVSHYEKMSGQGVDNYETATLAAYLIDGFAYMQDETDTTGKVFEKSSRPVANFLFEEMDELLQDELNMNLTDILEEIMAAESEIELPEIPMDFVKNILNNEFILIKNGDTTRVTLDLKQEYNEYFSYVGNLSLNTKIGDVVNYVLGHVDEELTWQGLTGAIKDKGSYTVATLVNVIDNELYNASGMHLQDVKDTIFAEPSIYDILLEEVGADMADMIVNTTVAELVGEYGALTVDNLIQMTMESETVTLSSLVTFVETVLTETTFGDIFEMEEAEVFPQIINVFKGVRVDDLNANLIFTVKNDKLTRVEVSYNVKFSVSAEGQSISIGEYALYYVDGFSSQAKTIALPTDSTVVIYCDECGLTVTENDYCAGCNAYVCEDCHRGWEHIG